MSIGGFLSKKSDVINEKLYPTTLSFYIKCKTGQIKEIIKKTFIYKYKQ